MRNAGSAYNTGRVGTFYVPTRKPYANRVGTQNVPTLHAKKVNHVQ